MLNLPMIYLRMPRANSQPKLPTHPGRGINLLPACVGALTTTPRALALGLCAAVAACSGSTDFQTTSQDTLKLVASTATQSPVIAKQPANAAVVAGYTVSFRVGATCNAGTLTVQWQRAGAHAFADITGETTPSLALPTWLDDDGAQFQAVVSCSGKFARTTSVVTLVVVAPPSVYLGALNYTNARS
ncbi:MAG: hypothetical protein ABIP34_01430 [Rhodoferax sp.]|uniref:hypothetical protein n=1 Tax=Rhodoferax sp. TaxID=50421 RepID=UPI003265BDCE